MASPREQKQLKSGKLVRSKSIRAERHEAAARALRPRQSKVESAKQAPKKRANAQRFDPELETESCDWVCSWEFEQIAREEGSARIAGVDEVGRGPLFGPVVAAAVILPHNAQLDGLNDSKQLSEEDRERFDVMVREVALCWSIAEVDVQTIDRINILQASKLAMKIAVEGLCCRGFEPDHLLIDGNQRIDYGISSGCRQTTIVQGDARSYSIAAASVIAKVHRDRLLCQLDERYPGYGLARNKGYSTPEHKAALLRLGATELHRKSFAPVAELFETELEDIGLEFDLFEA
jgi:ribonuclease HII